MSVLKRAAAGLMAAAVLAIGLAAPSQARDFDIYTNDDGELCAIMVAATEAEAAKMEDDTGLARRYVVEAIQGDSTIACSEGSLTEVSVIVVPERDSYGQPKWSSVSYIVDFEADLDAVRAIGQESGAAELEAALPLRAG